MQIVIDISKEKYDEIMSMDWVNCRLFFDEELRAIHDGKVLEPCGNCISRQAAIDAIWDGTNMDIYTREVKESLEKLPPVTPAEKVGRWNPYDGSWYECSECGAIREAVGYFENFCPNCGSKMSEIPTSCSTCILDRTDACTRGAGRAVDDEACEDYLASPTGAEGSE